MRNASKSEQDLAKYVRSAIENSKWLDCIFGSSKYAFQDINGNVFLVKDQETNEILEVEIVGNIDPGAWED